jgi:CRISPR/Cas system-associated exonuclease Cas4 (RecB family)
MSQYYNPNRASSWNYGGQKWKLSRSKIDLFVECPKCFYIDNKLGTKRPGGFPFNLNSAVDALLKKEFDSHREKGTTHPLMKEYGIDAVPFRHKDINTWRENFEGVQYKHNKTGITISGAVDDVWIDKAGKLLVVDYKATSKDSEITLDADWQDGYKRQMEVYQWLLRKNGFDVSNTGYFVYANGIRDKDGFFDKLEFKTIIIPYVGDDGWVEKTVMDIHRLLEQEIVPKSGSDCDFCPYRETVGLTLQKKMAVRVSDTKVKTSTKQAIKSKKSYKKEVPPDTGTLF